MLKKCAIAFGIISLVSLTACSKLTQENYGKLKMGMERPQVESLLGKPKECQSIMTAMNCTWEEGGSSVYVQYFDDKVMTFGGNKLK